MPAGDAGIGGAPFAAIKLLVGLIREMVRSFCDESASKCVVQLPFEDETVEVLNDSTRQ